MPGFRRERVSLRLQEGKLVDVQSWPPGNAAANFPLLTFIPLLLGYRSVEGLRHLYLDLSVAPAWRLPVEALFPNMTSFVYPSY